MDKPMVCRSFDDVLWAVGSTSDLARICGCRASAVSNWRKTGSRRIPARHYAVIAMALYERGYYAPWSLFHFTGIDRPEAA